jgi:hypothetical protein
MKQIDSQKRISSFGLLSLILGFTGVLYADSVPTAHANASACPGNVVPVPYHSLGSSQIAIPVIVNQQGPYEFMVDTGSQITVLEPSLAAELQLQPVGTAEVISGLHSALGTLVSPDLIEAGPYAVHPAWAVVQSLRQFQTLYPALRGILGEDFFMGFDMLIDRGKKVLCLDPTSDMRREVRGERVLIVRQSEKQNETQAAHPILIPAQLLGETPRKVTLRLDSGASAPILYRNHVVQDSPSQRLKIQRGSTAGGRPMYFRIMARQDIQIGKHVLSDIKFVAPVSSSQDVALVAEDGLLPTSQFKRVFISYRAAFIVLEPR